MWGYSNDISLEIINKIIKKEQRRSLIIRSIMVLTLLSAMVLVLLSVLVVSICAICNLYN